MEYSFLLSEKKMSFYLQQNREIQHYHWVWGEKKRALYEFKIEDQLIQTDTEFCLMLVSNKIELNILWYLSLSLIWIEK